MPHQLPVQNLNLMSCQPSSQLIDSLPDTPRHLSNNRTQAIALVWEPRHLKLRIASHRAQPSANLCKKSTTMYLASSQKESRIRSKFYIKINNLPVTKYRIHVQPSSQTTTRPPPTEHSRTKSGIKWRSLHFLLRVIHAPSKQQPFETEPPTSMSSVHRTWLRRSRQTRNIFCPDHITNSLSNQAMDENWTLRRTTGAGSSWQSTSNLINRTRPDRTIYGRDLNAQATVASSHLLKKVEMRRRKKRDHMCLKVLRLRQNLISHRSRQRRSQTLLRCVNFLIRFSRLSCVAKVGIKWTTLAMVQLRSWASARSFLNLPKWSRFRQTRFQLNQGPLKRHTNWTNRS